MNFPEKKIVAPLVEKLYQKAGKARIPLNGTFELTPMCNFACKMCYVRKTAKEVATHGRSMRTLSQWAELGRQARDEGMLYLLLTGGEPLLWPDFWELYNTLYDMGLLISVNTNGSLIDEKAIEQWRMRPPYRVNITLYGASDNTYEGLCGVKGMCDKVKEGILAMKEAGLMVKLNCSLTPYNATDLKEMVQFAKDNSVQITVSTYMYPPVRRDATMTGQNDRFTPHDAAWYHMQRYRYQKGEEAYIGYLRNIIQGMTEPLGLSEECADLMDGRIRCKAGTAAFWVTWDGYLTPCGMMPEPKIDIQDISFCNAWRKLVDISSNLHTSSVCEKCTNQSMCHSCAAMAYSETGKTSGIPTYLCEMTHAMRTIAREELLSLSG